jgi:hypothetical protein
MAMQKWQLPNELEERSRILALLGERAYPNGIRAVEKMVAGDRFRRRRTSDVAPIVVAC